MSGAKRSKGPTILVVLAMVGAVAFILVVQGMLSEGDEAGEQAAKTVVSTSVAPNPDNDPKVLAFVETYCIVPDRSLAGAVPAYDPSSEALASVFYDQAIGAPGPRTGFFIQPVAPKVGTAIEGEDIPAITATEVRLAACLERGPGIPTEVRCTYTQDPSLGLGDAETTLYQTPYGITVTEIHSGTVIATGEVLTTATDCPSPALVELSDNVSGPMTPELVTAWFSEHFVDGKPR